MLLQLGVTTTTKQVNIPSLVLFERKRKKKKNFNKQIKITLKKPEDNLLNSTTIMLIALTI